MNIVGNHQSSSDSIFSPLSLVEESFIQFICLSLEAKLNNTSSVPTSRVLEGDGNTQGTLGTYLTVKQNMQENILQLWLSVDTLPSSHCLGYYPGTLSFNELYDFPEDQTPLGEISCSDLIT